MITYHSVTEWLCRVRGTGRQGKGMEAPGWPGAATAKGFYPARHTLNPRHQLGFLFATRLLPLPLRCINFKNKQRKERFRPPSHHSQVGPLADVAVRPGGSPGLAPRPNRSRPTAALSSRGQPRGPLSGACARPGLGAAISGALEEVQFRVAAPLRGGPWGLVTRDGVHESPGGGAPPAAQRAAGARVGAGTRGGPFFSQWPRSAPKAARTGLPQSGGGTGVLKGRG